MATSPNPPDDADQYKDMRCAECGKSCKLRCLKAHIHKFACHTEGCLLRTESVHVDTAEGVFYLWKNSPNPDLDFQAASSYGTRPVDRNPSAVEDPDLEPPRHRSRKTRPPSPPSDGTDRKGRRSKPPPEKADRKARGRSPPAAKTDRESRRPKPPADESEDKLVQCSICGGSCKARCFKTHIANFSCHNKGCFLHSRPVKLNAKGVMRWWENAPYKPVPKPEPRPAAYGGGRTRHTNPFEGENPDLGPSPQRTQPPPFGTQPPRYYNVREVSPSREPQYPRYGTTPDRGRERGQDNDRTRERRRHSSPPESRRRSRGRETDRRAPSPSRDRDPRDDDFLRGRQPDGRDRRRAPTFPTHPAGNDPFDDPFFTRGREHSLFDDDPAGNDPFNHPFFTRARGRGTEPRMDPGRTMESLIDQSMADMNRMMETLGGRFGADTFGAGPPPPSPRIRRGYTAAGFMPGPPPSETDPYQPAPGRAPAQGYGYAPPMPGPYGSFTEPPRYADERTGRTNRRAPSPPRRRRTSRGRTRHPDY